MRTNTVTDHARLFEDAWDQPGHTAIELPAVDVDEVLATRYSTGKDVTYTRSMVWDMEVRKAVRPDKYIPTVVRPGSLENFGTGRNDRPVDFVRVTDQLLWLDAGTYGRVIEHVHLDHDNHRAFFIGAPRFTTPDGRQLVAGTAQPLFHVEHSVSGTEQRPLNHWRIVHLTPTPDAAMVAYFAAMAQDPYLRIFHEVYLREDLGLDLVREPLSSTE